MILCCLLSSYNLTNWCGGLINQHHCSFDVCTTSLYKLCSFIFSFLDCNRMSSPFFINLCTQMFNQNTAFTSVSIRYDIWVQMLTPSPRHSICRSEIIRLKHKILYTKKMISYWSNCIRSLIIISLQKNQL